MISESFDQPATISVDFGSLQSGKINIYVRWNITSIEHKMLNGKITPSYQYEEVKIKWTLPKLYTTKDEIISYAESIEDELLDWAKATTIDVLS